jgi:hypothetical protein
VIGLPREATRFCEQQKDDIAHSIPATLVGMQSAKNLRVYQGAEELAALVYQAARRLPPKERFGLAQQLRRAAVSIGSNIAEG